MPVWNRAATLPRALDSIVTQGFDEIVVIDDASTDGSYEIAKSYPQVHVIRHSQKSEEHLLALKPIIRDLTGDYLVGCASDDIYYPNMLSEMRSVVSSKDHTPGVIFCGFDFVNPEGEAISPVRYGHVDYVEPQMVRHVITGTETGCGSAIRRDLYLWLQDCGIHSLGAYSDSIGYTLAALKAGVAYRPGPVMGFTTWGSQENFRKRQLDSPSILTRLRVATKALLEQPGVAPLLSGVRLRTPLPKRSSFEEDLVPRFSHKTAIDLLGGVGKPVCLLFSTEFDGLYKNGGIGTYYRQIAKNFRRQGWYVVLVNLGPPASCQVPATLDADTILNAHHFLDHLECDHDTKSMLEHKQADWAVETSLKCFAYVRAAVRLFPDQKIYAEFPEMFAPGYETAKASESGLLGKNCIVGVTMHSGHEWIFEANKAILAQNNSYFLNVSTREEQSFAAADLPMFPSDSLHEITKSFGWRLGKAQKLPYFVPEV